MKIPSFDFGFWILDFGFWILDCPDENPLNLIHHGLIVSCTKIESREKKMLCLTMQEFQSKNTALSGKKS